MFFFLSKILAYLIMPLLIICGFLVASALVKTPSRKKRLFYIGLSLLLFASNDFIVNEVVLLWEVPITPMQDIKKIYTWGIVLTGVTKFDSGPRDRVFFNRGADRVTHAVQLYKMGKIKKILVTGGSGRLDTPERKEADEVAEALLLMGVPAEDIVKEAISRNTHESAVEVKKILQGNATPAECLLITSAYHMRRSRACYAKVGWSMDGFSVDFISHRRRFSVDALLFPKVEAISNWQTLLKEWAGMITYKLAGYI